MFQLEDIETKTLHNADTALKVLLDLRVLPDPLQDDVYLFSLDVGREMARRETLTP